MPMSEHVLNVVMWLTWCQDGTGGRMVVVGSCHMFSDQYLDKDGNEKFVDVMFQWMAGQIPLNSIDAEAPDVAEWREP